MKKIPVSYLLLGLFITLTSPVSHAQMYKCLDKSGKAKYQATKCPTDAKVSTVNPANKAKIPVSAEQQKIQALVSVSKKSAAELEEKIRLTTKWYDDKITELKRQNLTTNLVEQEKFLAIKAIREEQAKATEKHITALKNEQKINQDKAIQAEKDILQLKNSYPPVNQ